MSKPVFVSFNAIKFLVESEETSFCFGDFEYDYISDEEIKKYLNSASIEELQQDWMDQKKTNHAHRVACVVKLIESGSQIHPVSMELSEYNRNTNLVLDGHHRIRAFRYLKMPGFYAELGGYEKLIKEFKKICKTFSK